MAKKGKENKVVIFLLVLLIASAVFFISALYWANVKKTEMKEKIKKETTTTSTSQKLNSMMEFKSLMAKIERETKNISKTTPNTSEKKNTEENIVKLKKEKIVKLNELAEKLDDENFWENTNLTEKIDTAEKMAKLMHELIPYLPEDILKLKVMGAMLEHGSKYPTKEYMLFREYVKMRFPQLLLFPVEKRIAEVIYDARNKDFWKRSTSQIEDEIQDIMRDFEKSYTEAFGSKPKPEDEDKIKKYVAISVVLAGSGVASNTDTYKELSKRYLPKELKEQITQPATKNLKNIEIPASP